MYMPRARERVRMARRNGAFLVVTVDWDLKTVDLIPLQDAVSVEESIPFSEVEPYREEFPLETA